MSKIYLGFNAYIGKYQWTFPYINTASQGDANAPSLIITNIPSNASLIFGEYTCSLALGNSMGPMLGNNGFMISKGDSVKSYCSNIKIKDASISASGIKTTWNDSGIELIAYNYTGSGSSISGRPFGTNNAPNGYAYGIFYFFT